MDTSHMLWLAAALLGASIPIGLYVVAGSIFSDAAKRLAKNSVSIRKLSAIGNLDATSIVYTCQAAILAKNLPPAMDGKDSPLHPHLPNAVEAVRKAHIKVSVFTQQHAGAAKQAAVRTGLAGKPEDIIVITGDELHGLGDAQLRKLAQRGSVVFSRITPEDKARIVALARRQGERTAVIGSDDSDFPALTRADTSAAASRTGTRTVTQSAGILLLDDSFNAFAHAIREGRIASRNISKAAIGILTAGAAMVTMLAISAGSAAFLHMPPAVSVPQMLAITFLVGVIPAAFLSRDRADSNPMRDQPRKTKNRYLTLRSTLAAAWCGLLIACLAFANYVWFFERNGISPQYLATGSAVHTKGTTLVFLTVALCLLVHIVQSRTGAGAFSRYQLHNKRFWLGAALALSCAAVIIYAPWVASVFAAGTLGTSDWLYACCAAVIFTAIREFQRHNRKHHRKVVLEMHRKAHAHKTHLSIARD